MSLAIIIVNYKSEGLVIDCLRSFYGRQGTSDYDIIVVDNGSGSGGRELILAEFPSVKWIQMEYNAGFARGNNAGIRASASDTVLLLNSDTLVENDAIERCYRRLQGTEYIGAGVQLLNTDRSPQISGNYFMKGGLNHLMVLPYTGRMIRWLGLLLKVKKTNVPKAEGTVEVDWINGAFLMVKKTAIDTAGMLDEDFFLYSEEIEWCSRLRAAGKMCIYGDLHVVHLMGATTSKAFDSDTGGYTELSDRKGLQLMLSGMLRIRKQFGIGWLLFHLMAYLFTIPIYFIIFIIRTLLFQPHRAKEWKSWLGFTGNVLRVCGNLFRLLSNKPHFYKVL